MEMHREGRLTDEEAADLVEALVGRHHGTSKKENSNRESESPGAESDSTDSTVDYVTDLEDAMAGLAGWIGKKVKRGVSRAVGPRTWGDKSNIMSMSKADPPDSDASTCLGNSINVSHLSDIELKEASFCDNVFNASKCADFELFEGATVAMPCREVPSMN